MSSPLNKIMEVLDNPLMQVAMQASAFAFPPAAIASAVSNMAVSALGNAITGAMDQLSKQHGMPNFIADMVKNIVSSVLPQFMNPVAGEVMDFVQDKIGDKMETFKNDLLKDFMDTFMNFKKEAEEGKEGEGKAGSKSGSSWFVAMMQALGELQNQQAEKLEKLQGEVSDSLTGSDPSKEEKQAEFDKMEEYKAEAKLQEVLASVAKTVGDAVGNALNAVARPQ